MKSKLNEENLAKQGGEWSPEEVLALVGAVLQYLGSEWECKPLLAWPEPAHVDRDGLLQVRNGSSPAAL
jgi:hypothetical protein